MRIELNKNFAPNSDVDGYDVRQMKKALNRLRYYMPPRDSGISAIIDGAVFKSLKQFQADRGLKATGVARPNDKTVTAMNEALAEKPDGKYIWRTVGDEDVRPEHAALADTVRSYADSPDPGEDYNCRCWAEKIEDIDDPPIQPVYPEALLLPLLRVGKIYTLWKIWSEIKKPEWTLGKHKSPTRWGNQLRNRRWTPEQITKTIEKGAKYPAPNKVNKGNTATRYEYEGRYVVKDDQTNEILQVGGEDFKRPVFRR